MAAEHHYYVYMGEGDPPRTATHVTIHESITVIPEELFLEHPNIIELICHDRVRKVEWHAFENCPRLKRLVMPGVEEVEGGAFIGCNVIEHIECKKLGIISRYAFCDCESLGSIDLPSAEIVEEGAFIDCTSLRDVKFGKTLFQIEEKAFSNTALERIQIPLKSGLFDQGANDFGEDDVFVGCKHFDEVRLADEEIINETVDALLLDEWKRDMNQAIDSINYILPDAGFRDDFQVDEKSSTLEEWIVRVLKQIVHYKVEHYRSLSLAAAALAEVAPNEIIINSMLSWLQLPDYVFEGEGDSITTTPTLDRELWESIVQKEMLIRMKGDLREKEEKIVSLKSENDILKKSNDEKDDSIHKLEQRIAQLELQAAAAAGAGAGGASTQNDVGEMTKKRQRCSQVGVED